MGTGRTVLNALKAVGGFVVGAVTVFGWLSVTPEMVGQAAYDVMRGPAPLVVMFVGGSLFGWGVTKLWSDHRAREASDAISAELASRPTMEELDAANRQVESLSSKIKEMEDSPRYREPESIEELSASKLRLVLKLFDEAEAGSMERVMAPFVKLQSANLSSLVDMKVVMTYPDSMGLACVYQLTPKWTGIVRRNRERIEEFISSKENAPVDESLRDGLLRSSFRTKDVLLALCDMGSVDVTKDVGNGIYRECPEIECYVDFMDVGGGYERWVPKPGVREAVDALDEIFDPVREDRFSDRLEDPFGIGDTRNHKDVKRESGIEQAIDNVMKGIGPSTMS